MSNNDALGARIDALETRLTYQDETIETLNKTVTEQWKQIDALTRRMTGLADRLQQAESTISERGAHEPPPHY
ncbi:MAG TPA: SlyX family protein [Xanthobacteraceae bacterium]|jgi:SlyX protein